MTSERHVLDLLRGGWSFERGSAPDWNGIARQASDEGLAGCVLTILEREGRLGEVGAAARATLEAGLNAVRVEQTVLFHRFEALARCLRKAGVEFVVHKGGALAHLVYPRPEDRPMVDIDIVFRPRLWKRVRSALQEGGYRLPGEAREAFWLENYFNLSVMSPEDPPSHFDLHWSLTQEGRYHIDVEELLSRAVPFRSGSMDLLRLDDEDLLLSLFLHLAYHYFEARLIWLYDMKLVIERWPIDWDRLLGRARDWGLMTVVSLSFLFLERAFPGTVPSEAAGRARLGRIRRLAAGPLMASSPRHLFRGEERRINQFLIGLLAIDRPADSARFALDKVGRSLRWTGRRPSRR